MRWSSPLCVKCVQNNKRIEARWQHLLGTSAISGTVALLADSVSGSSYHVKKLPKYVCPRLYGTRSYRTKMHDSTVLAGFRGAIGELIAEFETLVSDSLVRLTVCLSASVALNGS
jgi:hypothetical protein